MRTLLAALALLSSAPTLAASTTVQMDSMVVNGQELRDIVCDLEEAGLFGPLAVVSAVARQKPALDACAPQGAAFRVRWGWGKQKAVVVEATAGSGAKDCVVAALQPMKIDGSGTCTAVLPVGDPQSARQAAQMLAPSPTPAPAPVSEGQKKPEPGKAPGKPAPKPGQPARPGKPPPTK